MREIKFRGKRVNGGEWVESMTISRGTIKRKTHEVFFEIDEDKWVGVIPESVSQFTGESILQGGELYEGDIVINSGGIKMIVIYRDGAFQFQPVGKETSYPFRYFKGNPGPNLLNRMKIIGNIHEVILNNQTNEIWKEK